MRKEAFRDVVICCVIFLLFVFGASLWIQKFQPYDKQNTTTVSGEQEKVVYLTFDDGPSQNTQAILDVLDTYKVKATFFVTGENISYQDLIFQEFNKGHAIGIHTYSHNYKEIYASEEAYLKDMEKVNALIEKQIGHKVNIFRFPGGASNTISRKYCNGIMKSLSDTLLKKGYQYYDWNASNGDGNSSLDSATLISTAIKEIGELDEVMLLMHDGAGNSATVKALPAIIEHLVKKGYTFKVINYETPVFHHHIAN
ncbi:MAG: polysaccharide deacetylase family protein [Longicatena sp.]